MIGGVLLAAGRGSRFSASGGGKLTAPLGDEPVVRHAARSLLGAPMDCVVVVTGADAERVRAALAAVDVVFVHNPRFAEGIGTSVACGIAALAPETAAAVIALGDQPFVAASVLRALVDAWQATGASIVAPRYAGLRGNPVLFDRRVFPELLALAGDVGARIVIERDPARVSLVEAEGEMPTDVDTPADLERLAGRA